MSHPLVVNRRHNVAFDVYVGRPTQWGNPYSHLKSDLAQVLVSSREEAVARYREWLIKERSDLIVEARKVLKGKVLSCWCAPSECHADVLAEIANGYAWKKSRHDMWEITLPSGHMGSVCAAIFGGKMFYTAAAKLPNGEWTGKPDHLSLENAKKLALELCK